MIDDDADGLPDAFDAAWASVRDGLRRDLGVQVYDRWLKPLRLQGLVEPGVMALSLPSDFMANWVTAHYAERIALAWRTTLPEVREVRIRASAERVRLVEVNAAAAAGESVPEPVAPVGHAPSRPRLDPALTFDRFVVGDENRMAANAARDIAAGERRYSPLFLHGATGQGKTHLLHAIGHAFAEAEPGASVLMLSAERFMVEFVQAMRDRDTLAFKARLRGADLLMIDDLQFIAGKGSTQEEFLHTIDELATSGARIVITADRSPGQLTGLEGRILSRLASGLVVGVKAAGPALRRLILEAKRARITEVELPDSVVSLVAERVGGSVRELEGALNRLVAYATLGERAIDPAFAAEVLGEMLDTAPRRVTIDDIQRLVSAHYGMRQAEMVSARRARAVARPRQVAMYLSKQLTPRSLPEIGRRFGGRDHTTVIHAVRQVEKLRADDAELDADVRALMRQLEA